MKYHWFHFHTYTHYKNRRKNGRLTTHAATVVTKKNIMIGYSFKNSQARFIKSPFRYFYYIPPSAESQGKDVRKCQMRQLL